MQIPPSKLLGRYVYDALDRIRIRFHALPEYPKGAEHQIFYCESRISTEISGVNRRSIFQYDDQILAEQQSIGGISSSAPLETDNHRSVMQSLRGHSAAKKSYGYCPYGNQPFRGGRPSLLFKGERLDPLTSGYLLGNGYRMYNCVVMRFNSPDNSSPFEKGGLNAYAYCVGDPVNFTDPTGHSRLGAAIDWLREKLTVSKFQNPFANPRRGQYLHIGTHSSPVFWIESLEQGLRHDLIGSRIGTSQGRGLYVTTSASKADFYAKDGDKTGAIFDVFMKQPTHHKRPNKYISTRGMRFGDDNEDIVIFPKRFKDVVLSARDAGFSGAPTETTIGRIRKK